MPSASLLKPFRQELWWGPPFFYGRVIIWVTFVAGFLSSGMGGLTLAVFLKPMHDSLGWSISQLTGAVTAAGIAGLLLAPVLGPLVDRFGARWTMAAGALASGLGLTSMMFIGTVWQFWLLFAFISAFGISQLSSISGPAVISKWFVRKRGSAMATVTAGIPLGAAVMVPLLTLLIGAVGWRHAWGVMGGVMLLVMLPLVTLLVRNRPEDIGLLPDGPSAEKAGAATTRRRPLPAEATWTAQQALRTRTFWLLIVAINLEQLVAGAMIYHQVPFLTSQGMSYRSATFFLSAFLGLIALSRIPWGFVLDRFPMHWAMSFLFLFKSLGVLTLVLVPYPYSVGTYLLLSGLVGGPDGLVTPLSFANHFGRTFAGSIQGAARFFLSPTQLVGPLLFAIVFDATGTYHYLFLVASSLGILSALLAYFARPPRHRLRHAA